MSNYYLTDSVIKTFWRKIKDLFPTKNDMNTSFNNFNSTIESTYLTKTDYSNSINNFVNQTTFNQFQTNIYNSLAGYGTTNYFRKIFNNNNEYLDYWKTKNQTTKLYQLIDQDYVKVANNDIYDNTLKYYIQDTNPYLQITNITSQDSLNYYLLKYTNQIYELNNNTYSLLPINTKYNASIDYYIKLGEVKYIEQIVSENNFNNIKNNLYYGTNPTYEEDNWYFFEPFVEYYETLNELIHEAELQKALSTKLSLSYIGISTTNLYPLYTKLGKKDFYISTNDTNPLIPLIINNILENNTLCLIVNEDKYWIVNHWNILYDSDNKPKYYLCQFENLTLNKTITELDNYNDDEILLNDLNGTPNHIIGLYNINNNKSYFKNCFTVTEDTPST